MTFFKNLKLMSPLLCLLCGYRVFCSFPSQQCSSYLSLHPTIPPLMATFAKLTKRKYYNSTVGKSFSATAKTSQNFSNLKGGYPIIFLSNVFHKSHLIQKCIQNQQQLMILYTFLKQMRVVKNIRRKDDRINSLYSESIYLIYI